MKTASEFLATISPPWVLVAISPDKKRVDHSRHSNAEEAQAWIDQYNGERNLYWCVNEGGDGSRPPLLHEITRGRFLHVDVDPGEGDLKEERAKIISKLEAFEPAPNVIIFSGGGYQAFWRLRDGHLDVEPYNRWLEQRLGGDHCHNKNRLMRLPFTKNLPDKKKRQRGRKVETAKIVRFDEGSYTQDQFQRLDVRAKGAGATVTDWENEPRVKDVNDLPLDDRVKVIIVQGHHPDQPKEKDNSRSAWVFDAACSMVRAGIREAQMFSILTDPEFGISESILGERDWRRAATRVITRAKEFAVDPLLEELNARFAVIGNLGGKCRVIENVHDPALGRSRLVIQSFGDFRNRYMNRYVETEDAKGNTKYSPAGDWWLRHAQRSQFDRLVFVPDEEVPDAYNLWQGFAVTPREGNCDIYLEHLLSSVCSGSKELFEYLWTWMARAVQYPAQPGEVAVVVRGGRGVGKGMFARIFGQLFGPHFMQVSNSSHIVGNFNAHLRDVVLLYADEAFYAGDKKHESVLKTLITEPTLAIEAKGVDVEVAPNYTHLIMTSNEEHVVPAGADERRFFVLDVQHRAPRSFFAEMMEQMDSGGREALLHALLTYPIERDVRDVPETHGLQWQKQQSLGPQEAWLLARLTEGAIVKGRTWVQQVATALVMEDFYEDPHTKRCRGAPPHQVAMGRFLHKMLPGLKRVRRRDEHEDTSHWYYLMPSLDDARKRWEELYGQTDWS